MNQTSRFAAGQGRDKLGEEIPMLDRLKETLSADPCAARTC